MEKKFRQGLLYSLAANFLWGVLPIYWKLMTDISSIEILAGRFIWSSVFVGIVVVCSGKWKLFCQETKFVFTNSKRALAMIIAALVICCNWGLFIWAVNHNHIVETSLGYYINPLLSVVLGILIYKERLNRYQLIAVICAIIGVASLIWQFGELPWISLVLAFSFATYGLIKKWLAISPLSSIMLEALLITPVAIIYEYFLSTSGSSVYQNASMLSLILLSSAGIATAIPLLFFTAGAKILPLKIAGFMQYISPTLSLILGVFLYKEFFTYTHLFAFGCIWFGLLIFSLSQFKKNE